MQAVLVAVVWCGIQKRIDERVDVRLGLSSGGMRVVPVAIRGCFSAPEASTPKKTAKQYQSVMAGSRHISCRSEQRRVGVNSVEIAEIAPRTRASARGEYKLWTQ